MLKTYEVYGYDEIVGMIGLGMPALRWYNPVFNKTVPVNCSSERLECLRRSPVCVGCGLVGTVFMLQASSGPRPHFNLYAVQDAKSGPVLVLMTKDHIVPKSRGGTDDLENLATMCRTCNEAKGNSLPGEAVAV